jgi:hypothetical protein
MDKIMDHRLFLTGLTKKRRNKPALNKTTSIITQKVLPDNISIISN